MTTPDQPFAQPVAPKPTGGLYIRLADILVGGGAILILLFSWAPLVGYSLGNLTGANLSGRSLWSWLSPLGLFVLLATLLLLGTAIMDTWWHRDKPMVGLHRHVVQVGLALFVFIDIFGMAFADPSSGFIGISYGGFLELLFAAVALAGAVLNHFGQLQNPIGMPNVSVKAPAEYTPPAYAPPAQVDPTTPAPVDPTVPPAGS